MLDDVVIVMVLGKGRKQQPRTIIVSYRLLVEAKSEWAEYRSLSLHSLMNDWRWADFMRRYTPTGLVSNHLRAAAAPE